MNDCNPCIRSILLPMYPLDSHVVATDEGADTERNPPAALRQGEGHLLPQAGEGMRTLACGLSERARKAATYSFTAPVIAET